MNINVLDILKESGALLQGHFLLSSGRHSDRYCQCARLLQYPDKAAKVLSIVTQKIKDIDFDVVVGPAMGGIVVAYEVGRQSGKPAIFTERVNGKMELRRGFEIIKGQKVLIAEDVVTTGKSSLETIEALKELGAEVVGICCIVDRGSSTIDYPIYSCINLEIQSYDASECPHCKAGEAYVKPGSREIK